MSKDFDPYHTWLGIPPEEQPADHYRLLGLKCWETNLDVISHASDQRLTHLRNMQNGKRSQDSQRLLNELSAATTTLLDPEKKSAYDANLRAQRAAKPQNPPKKALPVATPLAAAPVSAAATPVAAVPVAAEKSPPAITPTSQLVFGGSTTPPVKPNRSSGPLVATAVSLTLLAILVLGVGAYFRQQPRRIAQADPQPVASQPAEDTPAVVQKVTAPQTVDAPTVVAPSQPEDPDPSSSPAPTENNSPPASPASTPSSPAPAPSQAADDAKPLVNAAAAAPLITNTSSTSASPAAPQAAPHLLRFHNRSQVVLANSAKIIDYNLPFTIEFWLRITPVSGANGQQQVDLVFGNLKRSMLRPRGAELIWEIFGWGSPRVNLPVLTGKEWVHLALTSDGNTLATWVNGRLSDTAPTKRPPLPPPADGDSNYTIGNNQRYSATSFVGDLGGLRISKIARYQQPFTPAIRLENDSAALLALDFVTLGSSGRIEDLSSNSCFGQLKDAAWIPGEVQFSPPALVSAKPGGVLAPQPVAFQPPGAQPAVTQPTVAQPAATQPPDQLTAKSPPPAQSDLRPIPAADALARARGQLAEIFGDEVKQAVRPEQKSAIGRKLVALANESKDDDAARYALLEAARKLLIAAGEVRDAIAALEGIISVFRIDAWDARVSSYEALQLAPLTPDGRRELINELSAAVNEAIQSGQADLAETLATLNVKVAVKLQDTDLRKAVTQRRAEVLKLKPEFAAGEKARETLKTAPEDSAARAVLGRFLCLILRDWEQGLPHLAKGDVAELAEAGRRDLAAEHGPPAAKVAAADAWYEWASSAKGADKDLASAAQARAKLRYQQALPNLNGLERAKTDKRLQELAAIDIQPATNSSAAKGPAGANTPSSSAPPAIASTTPPATTKPAVTPRPTGKARPAVATVPGMVGRIFVDNTDTRAIVNYTAARTVTGPETEKMIADLGATGRSVRVEFAGVVVIPVDGKYVFHVMGGSSSGGVLTFFLGTEQLMVVGDDRNKNETRALNLPKGEYPVRWVWTGGSIGGAMFDVEKPQDAPNETPRATVVFPQDAYDAFQKNATKVFSFVK